MQFFDTHAHIGLITEDPIEQLIIVQEAKQEGVSDVVSISSNLRDFHQIYQNLRTESRVWHSVGISPSEVVAPG